MAVGNNDHFQVRQLCERLRKSRIAPATCKRFQTAAKPRSSPDRQMLGEDPDFGLPRDGGPIGQPERCIGIVIKDSDTHHVCPRTMLV
jgi:hypothetical protein